MFLILLNMALLDACFTGTEWYSLEMIIVLDTVRGA
jgi:hypothetical protein